MSKDAIERDVVMVRVNGIEGELAELGKLAQVTQYSEMARKLGEIGIVPKELYGILQKDLRDFTIFLTGIKKFLEYSEQFGLTVE